MRSLEGHFGEGVAAILNQFKLAALIDITVNLSRVERITLRALLALRCRGGKGQVPALREVLSPRCVGAAARRAGLSPLSSVMLLYIAGQCALFSTRFPPWICGTRRVFPSFRRRILLRENPRSSGLDIQFILSGP